MAELVWIHPAFKCPDSQSLTYSAEYTRWGNTRALARSQAAGLAARDVVDALQQQADMIDCPGECEKKVDGPHGGLISVRYFQSWRSLWIGVYCTARVTGTVTISCAEKS